MLFCLHAQTVKLGLFEVLVQTHNFTLKEGESECIKRGVRLLYVIAAAKIKF